MPNLRVAWVMEDFENQLKNKGIDILMDTYLDSKETIDFEKLEKYLSINLVRAKKLNGKTTRINSRLRYCKGEDFDKLGIKLEKAELEAVKTHLCPPIEKIEH